jgi:hypothetical protein
MSYATYAAVSLVVVGTWAFFSSDTTGLALASAAEVSFNLAGFSLAILSSFASTAFNLLTKKLMANSNLDNFQIQYYVSCICLLFMLPIWVLVCSL